MTAREELRAELEGTSTGPTIGAMRTTLSQLLRVAEEGLAVERVVLFGNGPLASVDVVLSNGTTLTAERFGDLMSATKLAALITTSTGIPVVMKAPEAVQACALIRRLAEVHETASRDHEAAAIGAEWLQECPTFALDWSQQAQRFRAFQQLDKMRPVEAWRAGDARSIALGALDLVDESTGTRFVRCGWFHDFARSRDRDMGDNAAIAQRMERVGWSRRATHGRIKATNPWNDGPRALAWSFFVVEHDWEPKL